MDNEMVKNYTLKVKLFNISFVELLVLIGDYVIAYSIDKKTYIQDRKTMKIKRFGFLFMQYKKKRNGVIAIDTFAHELLTILLMILSLSSMTISFFVSDIVKVILGMFCFLLTLALTVYLSTKDNKLQKKK
jgi:hypothetical protein